MKTKREILETQIRNLKSAVVAFSGGVDSTFLLAVCAQVLKGKLLAVTGVSASIPKSEVRCAQIIARDLRVKHVLIKTKEFSHQRFVQNSRLRCYYCKQDLFKTLTQIASQKKLIHVLEATTLTDATDIRPGNKAKKEFNIISPLQDAGYTKEDVRRESKRMGLITWNKPSMACLASRVPFGVLITPELMQSIEQAEEFLKSLGLHQVRLRHHGAIARIEVCPEDFAHVLSKRKRIIDTLRNLGYNYITLDLCGYRTGSMNEK